VVHDEKDGFRVYMSQFIILFDQFLGKGLEFSRTNLVTEKISIQLLLLLPLFQRECIGHYKRTSSIEKEEDKKRGPCGPR
jgi:hypothetical protein